jgi:hypothetical protein
MTTEELAERYKAGQTDLKKETFHIYKTEGAATAYDFARWFDENVGSGAYNSIMKYIADFIEADKAPQINQKAVLAGELTRANLAREKALKQAEQDELAFNLQNSRGVQLPRNLTVEERVPLFTEKTTGPMTGLPPEFREPDRNLIKKAKDNNMLLIIALVVVVAGFLLMKKD